MQGIEQRDGQVIRAEPAFFNMAVEKDDRRVASVAPVARVDHARHGINQAAFVERGLGWVPQIPGIETSWRQLSAGTRIDLGHVQHDGWAAGGLSQLGGFNGAGVLLRPFVSLPIN